MASRAFTLRGADLHVVVLDKDARSWFIADSSLRGYDGARNVRDEENSLRQKKLVRKAEPPSKRGVAWPRWTGFRGMTLRSWLELLVVPLALVVIGLVFTMLQDARQQEIENQRARQAQKIENQRADAERELAEQRAQDEALQAYLNQMSQLMLDRKLLEAEAGDSVHTLAQARTSTVILRLDAEHNESVTRFLIDSGLAVRSKASASLLSGITLENATLHNAQLPDANLSSANLRGADLSNAFLYKSNLLAADLRGADLRDASLEDADLKYASLEDADLRYAFLPNAFLPDAFLRHADLRYALLDNSNLSDADLRNADLRDTYLRGANLTGADLTGATRLTDERIAAAESLEGATMPNGQKYEEWLKSRGEENSGPS
jgi:uncharacterized protein YjbI with pentapeptide repeats